VLPEKQFAGSNVMVLWKERDTGRLWSEVG